MSTEQEQSGLSAEEAQKYWDEVDNEEELPVTPAQASQETDPEEEPAAPEPQAADPRDIKPEYVSALEAQVNELKELVKSSVGRVGSLQSALDKMQKHAEAPTAAAVAQAAKSSAKWEAMKKDFPDFAEAVEEYSAGLVASNPSIKPEELLAQSKEFAESRASEVHIRNAKALATLVEPDWEKTVTSEEFQKWLGKQSADVFAAAARASAEWDAPEVVKLVRGFKSAAAPQRGTGSNSQRRLASAAVPTGVHGARTVDESDLDGEAYWKQLAKEEARQRK